MTSPAPSVASVLIVTAGARTCALPLEHVIETMRPLTVEALSRPHPALAGVAVIRGAAVPVLELQQLLGEGGARVACTRFVTLRLGERCAALAVSAVIGVQRIEAERMRSLPPLLRDASAELVESIGVVDAQLWLGLSAARVVPDEVWAALEPKGDAA